MRTAYVLDRPPPRPSGAVGPWIETGAWLLAFALLLAAPCAPERASPGGGRARVSDPRSAVPGLAAPRGGARPPP
jgi:hypothetical protein